MLTKRETQFMTSESMIPKQSHLTDVLSDLGHWETKLVDVDLLNQLDWYLVGQDE